MKNNPNEWARKTSKPKLEDRPLPAGEWGVGTHRLKVVILQYIEENWGPRCKTKDYEDFPELHDNLMPVGDDAGRCPVCVVYERFDRFWERLIP